MSSSNADVTVPTGSVLPHQLLWILQLVALLSPRFPFRSGIFSTAILACVVWANWRPHFSNDVESIQPYVLSWAFYLGTLDKLLLGSGSPDDSPEASFWHKSKKDDRRGEALNFASFGWNKFKWAFVLIFGARGIGWNHEIKNVPVVPLESRRRWRFVVVNAIWLVYHFAFMDLLISVGRKLWYTGPNGVTGDVNSKYLTLRSDDWTQQFIKCLVWGMTPYHAIQFQYVMCAIIGVASGLSKVEENPPFFGKLKDVTTVRHFWGTFWHQTIRRGITSFTGAFVDLVGIKRGTNLSSYVQLWTAFSVSAAAHAAQTRMFPSPTNITFEEKVPPMILFFLFQAAAITFEDFAQWIWKKMGYGFDRPSFLRTLVGYIWVTWSFWYSIPFAADTFLRLRIWEDTPMGFSIFESALSGIVI